MQALALAGNAECLLRPDFESAMVIPVPFNWINCTEVQNLALESVTLN
jgi:hypothetical protein